MSRTAQMIEAAQALAAARQAKRVAMARALQVAAMAVEDGKPVAAAAREVGISRTTLIRALERSTRASAAIEGRIVPPDYVRPAAVDRFLADRQPNGREPVSGDA